MPVELFVKIVGSDLSLERVNELTQSSARVKDCTPDELQTDVLGPLAMTRLANTVDMMRRMDVSARGKPPAHCNKNAIRT